MIIVLVALVILETAGLIFMIVRGNKIDGEIHVSVIRNAGEGTNTVWNIRSNTPDKITEANGQIVKFRVIKENDMGE